MSALKVPNISSVKQPTIEHITLVQRNTPSTSDRAQRITTKIAHFIVKDMRPKRIVYTKEFREMMAECEPQYQIPSVKHFRML